MLLLAKNLVEEMAVKEVLYYSHSLTAVLLGSVHFLANRLSI